MALRVEALGRLRFLKDGGELTKLPGMPRRACLLLYIACQRSCSREAAYDLFWPGVPTKKASGRLSTMVNELRNDLGDDWLTRDRHALIATDALTSDVVDFESSLEVENSIQATRLYRGDFLGAEPPPVETPGFTRWTETTRDRLSRAHRRLLSDHVGTLDAAGDLTGALAAARRWVLVEPYDDDAVLALVTLLARAGLRNEALREYRAFKAALAASGETPRADLVDAVASIRRGDVEVTVPSNLSVAPDARIGATLGVAVLPIENLTGRPEMNHFGSAVAEGIVHALGSNPKLRTVPRDSTKDLAPRETVDEEALAARVQKALDVLGVSHAVEGSVTVGQDRFRVRISVIRQSTLDITDSKLIEGSLADPDLLDVQDEAARFVLDTVLGDEPPGRADATAHTSYKPSPEVQDLYARGRYAWFQRTEESFEEAIRCFEKAIELDPKYARAWAGLADVYSVQGGIEYATKRPREIYEAARTASDAALDLDPGLAEALASRGNYLMCHVWRWEEAEVALRSAIEHRPGYSIARQWYSNYLMYIGLEDEAVAEASYALELDPRSGFLNSSLARHYQLMRQPDAAVRLYDRALTLDPELIGAHGGRALAVLQAGRVDEAVANLEGLIRKVDALSPSGDHPVLLDALLAYALGRAGAKREAKKLIERRLTGSAGYLAPGFKALGWIGIDRVENALTQLELARTEHSQSLTLLRAEPIFDPLRGEKRFAKLLRDVGLSDDHVEELRKKHRALKALGGTSGSPPEYTAFANGRIRGATPP